MFRNVFTDYLVNHGWIEVNPMEYKNENSNLTIFFDTSNQIEINKDDVNKGSFFIRNIDDLIEVLDNL